jgi:hypothetical protein
MEVEGEPLSLPRKVVTVLRIVVDSGILAPISLSMMHCFFMIVLTDHVVFLSLMVEKLLDYHF